ncbi:AAA family ATPase [Aeoliella mucimassa]|uniref:Regulatory protein RepA n=1 Tax=Aeoliella mucimassa TaxID=2527972 RepID=A0A518AN57_9BACT|nr:AAA family ATPase [Aeoliella mucimassa]QDU56162.1 hypothetical protein Pan181_23660 [Aeoliella mucimassa]
MNTDPVQQVLDRLEGVRQSGKQWSAQCPAHEDRTASLSVCRGDDGRCLIHCHAGCDTKDVVAAMRLDLSDLMYEDGLAGHYTNGQSKSVQSSAQKPKKQKLYSGKVLATYDYTDPEGNLLYQVRRHEAIDETGAVVPGKKTFRQWHQDASGNWVSGRGDAELVPYELPRLLESSDIRFIFEGEKDCDAANEIGLTATTNVSGAGKWTDSLAKYFADTNVVIVPDNDEPGRMHAQQVAASLHGVAESVRILELPNLPPKGDFSDWLDIEFGDSAEPDDIAKRMTKLAIATTEWTPADAPQEPESDAKQVMAPIAKFTVDQLREQHPKLHEPVVDGLFRKGEIFNIVGATKSNKSWTGYGILFSIGSGRPWLDRFETRRGRVLLIDNELHAATLSNRLASVITAMGLDHEDYADTVEVWSLRGNMRTLPQLMREFDDVPHGHYSFILLDARYRFSAEGSNENSNDENRDFYNCADQLAAKTGAAVGMVHHSTKGDQADKRVTDVGSGGGSQSRAADSHLVLREHVDEGCMVLDAAVRSFKRIDPVVLRWEFPLWRVDEQANPKDLKGARTKQQEQRAEADAEADKAIVAALMNERLSIRKIRETVGMGRDRVERRLDALQSQGHVAYELTNVGGNKCREYYIPNEALEGGGLG